MATYYVKNGGNDSAAGTSSAPWANIPGTDGSTHTSTVQPGDTVYCDNASTWTLTNEVDGAYYTLFAPVGGVTYDGRTWGAGTKATIVSGSGDDEQNLRAVITFCHDHATYDTVVDGFDVDCNDQYTTGVMFSAVANPQEQVNKGWKKFTNSLLHDALFGSAWHYAIRTYSADWGGSFGIGNVRYVEVSYNEVYNFGHDGVAVYPTNDLTVLDQDIIFRGNVIHDIAQNCGIGVKGRCSGVIIEYNYTYNCGYHNGSTEGHSLLITDNEEGNSPLQDITVRHNIFNGSGASNYSLNGIVHVEDTTTASQARTLKFYGNILYGAKSGSAGLNMGSVTNTYAYIYNNTLFNASIVMENSNYTEAIIKNNISYGTGAGITISETGATESNNSTDDPSFKNTSNLPTGFLGTYPNMYPNNDGLSASGASVVDQGVDLGSSYNKAMNGYRTGTWDIGAYESGATFGESKRTLFRR